MNKKEQLGRHLVWRAWVVCLLIFACAVCQAQAQDASKLHLPTKRPKPIHAKPLTFDSDILLVMPKMDADSEDIEKSLREAKGTIVGTIGAGKLTVYKVKVERGELSKAQDKLSKDKNFSSIELNYHIPGDVLNASGKKKKPTEPYTDTTKKKKKKETTTSAPSQDVTQVNDPYFNQQWHLAAVNGINAWRYSLGSQATMVGVLDTGTNYSIADLAGKTYAGYNAVDNKEGQSDIGGHGTMVATTACANTDNSLNTASIARLAKVYPVRIATMDGYGSLEAILNGIYRCGQMGVKIINLSFNGEPPYTLANKKMFPIVHEYLKWYHDEAGGLFFNSAGNSAGYDNSPMQPYLIVVSAIDTDMGLAYFSNYGNCIWFTAPGTSIYCSDMKGKVASVAGTSFSSPICASIAALVWGANPGLTNTQVEQVLRATCYKANGAAYTTYYGYGLPNAEAAVRMAVGR